MEMERYYKKLIESLKLLSLNFNDQQQYFPEFADIPFEILDTYEKAFCLLPQLIEANVIKCYALPNLLRLHNLINIELQNSNFDTLEVNNLYNSSEWIQITKLSKEILTLMNEPIEKPNSNYL